MTDKPKKRKVGVKSTRKRRTKKKETSLSGVESSMDEMALSHFAETTREQLKKLGDKIHEATDKGVHVVKEIAEDVQRFAREKTEFTRIKIDLHNLKAERDKLYMIMGEQLRNLYKANKLSYIKKRFKDDFDRLDELETAIKNYENRSDE